MEQQRDLTLRWPPSWFLTAISDAQVISFHWCLAPASFNNRWWDQCNLEPYAPVISRCLVANMSSLRKTLVWQTALPRNQYVVTQTAPVLNLVAQAAWCSTQLPVWMKNLQTLTVVMMKRCCKIRSKNWHSLHARWIHLNSTQGTSTGSSILSWNSASEVTSQLRMISIQTTLWTCAVSTERFSLTFSKV